MTEYEWLIGADPVPMIDFMTSGELLNCADPILLDFVNNRIDTIRRKIRLFIAGCCYLVELPTTEAIRFGLDVAARLAEVGGVKLTTARVILPAGQVALDCSASEPI